MGEESDRYEDFVQKLRDRGRDDLAQEAERFTNREMRKRIGYVVQVERELAEAQAEYKRLTSRPVKMAALERVGVDLVALDENPAVLEVIENAGLPAGKEFDEEVLDEWARALMEKYRLPIVMRR